MPVDYRCPISGVSLLGAETMVVLGASPSELPAGSLRPVALPLWGLYDGSGTVVDINEGPNAERILGAFVRDLGRGEASVDWTRLGTAPFELDHIETLVALFRLNEIHDAHAIYWHGHTIVTVLIESNVAAAWMQDDPAWLMGVPIDDLPAFVFEKHPVAHAIYEDAKSEGPRLRCKYGLSLVALASLDAALRAARIEWQSPGKGIDAAHSEPALWLAEAYRDLAADEAMREALSEYASALANTADEDDETVYD